MIYKGKLEVRKEDCQTMKVATHHEHSSFAFTETFQSLYQKLGVADKKVLYDYITSQVTGLSEITDEVKKVLNKLLNSLNISSEDLDKADVLYSELEIEGIKYGRELFTGLIFPLFEVDNGITCDYLLSVVSDYEVTNCGPMVDTISFTEYHLERTVNIDIPEVPKCVCLITPKGVANNNEISTYLQKLNKGLFHKKREQLFRKKLTYLYNSNVYVNNHINNETISTKDFSPSLKI